MDNGSKFMRIIKVFLLLSLGLWAEINVNNTNNKIFYEEVKKVFVQPLYRPINTARFEDMNGTEMSPEMRQSIEEFLPIYLNTKAPLCRHDDNYPTTEIQRFFKVLNKYMDILESENKDEEIYEILDKRLYDAHACIQNASSLLDLIFGMSYYRNILYLSRCNDGISEMTIRKKCDNNQMASLLKKYNVPNIEYFFDVLEEERKQNVNTMLNAIKKEGISKKNLDLISKELTKYTKYYYIKYGTKLKNTVIDDSYEALDEYENYMNAEFESLQSIETITKNILSQLSLKVQKIFSIETKSYGYFMKYRVKTMAYLSFLSLGDSYKRYRKFLKNYDELLKNCPQNN